jgi:hypothetical protein
MNTALEEKIRKIRSGLDAAYEVSKFRIPFNWLAQKTPKDIANMVRIETMRGVESLEAIYARRPEHFVQIITDREKVAQKVERVSSVEEARKILLDSNV